MKKTIIFRTIFIIILATTIASVGYYLSVKSIIEDFVIGIETETLVSAVHQEFHEYLDLSGELYHELEWNTPEMQVALLGIAERIKRLYPATIAFKVYDREGTLVATDRFTELLGQKVEEEDFAYAVRHGKLIEFGEDEIQNTLGAPDILEVYVPIHFSSDEVFGLFELYLDGALYAAAVERIKVVIFSTAFAAMLFIAAFLFFVLRKLFFESALAGSKVAILTDQAPVGIFTVNREGIIDYYNEELVRIFGEQNIKKMFKKNISSVSRLRESSLDRLLKEGLAGKPFDVQLHESLQEGSRAAHMRYKGRPVFSPPGEQVQLLLVMVEDITKHKHFEDKLFEYTKELEAENAKKTDALKHKIGELEKTEQTLLSVLDDVKRSEEQFREEHTKLLSIVESMEQGLIVVDPKKRVLLINKEAERLADIRKETVVDMDFEDVIALYKGNTAIEKEEYPVTRTLKDGKTRIGRLEHNYFCASKNGKRLPIAFSCAFIGKDIGAVFVFWDVTQEKVLDDAKDNFIAIASHQLRTPLTSIRWYAEMMVSKGYGELNAQQEEFMGKIYAGAVKLNEIIKILLSLAQSDSKGLGEFEFQKVDVRVITDEILEQHKEWIVKKHLNVRVDIDMGRVKEFYFDAPLLRQVISNLVSNSVAYTNTDGRLEISAKVKDNRLEYSVKDDGIGIPQDAQGKIFTRFYRAENARLLVPEGNGLGLAFIKSLVEGWNGKLSFASPIMWKDAQGREEMRGTIFTFTIPFRCENEKKCISYFVAPGMKEESI